MERFLDLDALAAERAEARGEPPTLQFKGETFTLPVELPVAVAEAWITNADAFTFGKTLLGEEWDRFYALEPSQDDVFALSGRLSVLYGVTEGESSASGEPSPSTSGRSRPTSSASITSISDDSSGEPTQSEPVGSSH